MASRTFGDSDTGRFFARLVFNMNGDTLDAVLCLMQAAWAQGQPGYGLPAAVERQVGTATAQQLLAGCLVEGRRFELVDLDAFGCPAALVPLALEAVAEQMDRRGDKLDLQAFAEQQRLEITPPLDLQRRYERYPRELQPPPGRRLALSTEVAALQRALEQSRRQDSSRPELEFLWDLHPLVDWLADRGQIAFQRHCAPVLQLSDGLEPGEAVMVFQGTIPNQKGVPVVQEWVAVRFAGSGLKVAGVEPFQAVAERLQLGRQDYANPQAPIPGHLREQLPYAVEQANTYLRDCGDRWTARMQPELEAQRERLKRLRGRQEQQLELSFAADQRPPQIKEKRRLDEQKAIAVRFNDHERFVAEVMTIEPAPYLKLVAVLHREAT